MNILWHFPYAVQDSSYQTKLFDDWLQEFQIQTKSKVAVSAGIRDTEKISDYSVNEFDSFDLIITSNHIEERAREAKDFKAHVIYFAEKGTTFTPKEKQILKQRYAAIVTHHDVLRQRLLDEGLPSSMIHVVRPTVVKRSPNLEASFGILTPALPRVLWGHHLDNGAHNDLIPPLLEEFNTFDLDLYFSYKSQLPINFKQRLEECIASKTRKRAKIQSTAKFQSQDYWDWVNQFDVVLSLRQTLDVPYELLVAQALGIPVITPNTPIYKAYVNAVKIDFSENNNKTIANKIFNMVKTVRRTKPSPTGLEWGWPQVFESLGLITSQG